MAPFLVVVGPVFAPESGITLERWVGRCQRCLPRGSCRILHRAAALGKNLGTLEIPKNSMTIVSAFCQFMQFVRFKGNSGYIGFRGR